MVSREQDVLISSGQAAQILGVSSSTVRRLITSGQLPCQRTPHGHGRIWLSDVHAFSEKLKAGPSENAALPVQQAGFVWSLGGEQGQGLVEFAFVLPILLLILLGGIYFGNVMRQVNAMHNAVDGGAFYASLGHGQAEVQDFVNQRLSEELVNPDEVEFGIDPATYSYGDAVTVSLTKTMAINALLWESSFPIVTRSTQIIQKEVAGP